MRRLLVLFFCLPSVSFAQTSWERVATAARLWNYVKYFHPRVAAPGVDWDAAFAQAVPKAMAAKTDDEFVAVIDEMLGTLHDPSTHVFNAAAMRQYRTVARMAPPVDGVTVVTFETGDQAQVAESVNSFPARIAGAGNVVFDLRGLDLPPFIRSLPLSKPCIGPAYASREHSGYANADNSGSGNYSSSWKIENGESFPASSQPIRPVFLINSHSALPSAALTAQNCGVGAIVSEDPVAAEQSDSGRPVPGLGRLLVMVRTYEFFYPDGATGFSPNAVLNKTGEAALQAAREIARSRNWPVLQNRPRSPLPPALFTENNYEDDRYPAMEHRVLAAARIWGVFHYFHAYLHLYGEDWDQVLLDFLPKFAAAANAREYALTVAEMVAHTHDTHCIVASPELVDFIGPAVAGIELLWIGGKAVVVRALDGALQDRVHPGDVVVKIDGEPVQKRIDAISPYLAASTPQSLMKWVMEYLLRGPAGAAVKLTLQTATGEREVEAARSPGNFRLFRPYRGGDVVRLAAPRIGYVDLERLSNGEIDAMFDKLKDTDGIIFDLRGYPQGTVWSIAPRLADGPGKTAAVIRRNLVTATARADSAGQKLLFEQSIALTNRPRYAGKTVALIDERAISQAEHSGLLYKTANGTVFIGSPTQGANGDVTWFMAPGGIRIQFSGQDIRWPDGKQLQRTGLTPDILVRPTIEGLRAGRDEVLERGIEYLQKGH